MVVVNFHGTPTPFAITFQPFLTHSINVGDIMMFMLKHVRVFEKSRTCLKKFMYVFFYKMIGIQLYMFKSYNNSTLQGFVIKDIADIYRVSKKRLKCDSKRRWGTMKIYYHHSICTL